MNYVLAAILGCVVAAWLVVEGADAIGSRITKDCDGMGFFRVDDAVFHCERQPTQPQEPAP